MAKQKHTQIGLHSIRNILGEEAQTSLFSDHSVSFCSEYGVQLQGTIDRFGVDLSDTQSKIMEGILKGFSETAYKGNLAPLNKEQIVLEKYNGKAPSHFQNIDEIPRLKITQSKLLELAGVNKSSIASWARAVEAIGELGSKQFCFYYDRLVYDDNRIPQKHADGRWKKEEVIAVDTLFTIKEVREEGGGNLKYYEIEPSPIFLDQRESFFVLIPFDWREEVKELVGSKKASSYTFRFLLFLRYQFELFRRSKRKNDRPYQIKWSPEEISQAIKMPESIYHRKKARALGILGDAYTVAKRLGYLSNYEIHDYLHVLTLNENKYTNNSDKPQIPFEHDNPIKPTPENPQAVQLFNLFHEIRKSLDMFHTIPIEGERKSQLEDFFDLLKLRSFGDIESVIRWGLVKKYWCSRIFTPSKLKTSFGEVWSEFHLSKNENPEVIEAANKQLVQDKLSQFEGKKFGESYITILNKYIEIGNGVNQSSCVHYNEKNFLEKLKETLYKWRIPVDV